MNPCFSILLAISLFAVGKANADEGIWGGKWDDSWPVFIFLKRDAESNTFSGRYYWLENLKKSSFSVRELPEVAVVDGYFVGKFLSFKLDSKKGMVHGNFRKPRMANLVRIHGPMPTVEECDEVLAKYGWKPGAIPADEALERIKQ